MVMPSFGDILIRVVTTDSGLEFLHAALYIDTPSHFEKHIPCYLLQDTPPSTSSGATEKEVTAHRLVKDILPPRPFHPDKPYIIHFSGDLDAMMPTDENSQKSEQRKAYDFKALLFMLSGSRATSGKAADGSEVPPAPGDPLVKVALYEQEFGESRDRTAIHQILLQEKIIRSPDETVREAFQRIGTGFGGYHVLRNNCQHFVTFCKYARPFLLPEQKDHVKNQILSAKKKIVRKIQGIAKTAASRVKGKKKTKTRTAEETVDATEEAAAGDEEEETEEMEMEEEEEGATTTASVPGASS